jgi:hypothetical protein
MQGHEANVAARVAHSNAKLLTASKTASSAAT